MSQATDAASILVVDDERGIRQLLYDYLSRQNYRILLAENAAEARRIAAEQSVDVAILDIRMPGEDGLSLARFLREVYDPGIIMLTASGEVIDRIVGLEIGADDYMAKPFEPRELLARIKNLLRRLNKDDQTRTELSENQSGLTRLGNYAFDHENQRLLSEHGEPVALTNLELDLLIVLMQNPNRVLNRDELLNLTQGRDWDPYDRSIDVRILRLRRKIEPDPGQPKLIKTIHRKGYMLALDPESGSAEPSKR